MIQLQVKNLAKSFGDRPIFSEINFTLKNGESLAVVGRNGSGKSTLLRILAGLLRPNHGTLEIRSEQQLIPREYYRPLIGLVAPDLVLYEELTALENLQFFSQLRKLSKKSNHIEELLAQVGLIDREQELVSSYSSGMKQRLKYAYALLQEPPILLLDEPGANLDQAGNEMVAQIIQEQKRRGILILATNEPEEIPYGDQILRLEA